jgi:hypothetical protein
MRCAEQLGRRGGHIHRLHGRRRVGQVRSGLEEDSVEERLELWGLERMAPVVGGEEGRDERDAQVRDRQVTEQQLGVLLAKRARVGHVQLAKVGQLPPDEGGDQRSSVAIIGNQRSSEATRSNQMPLVAISAHQRSSALISAHQRSSAPLRRARGRQLHACEALRGHQRSSEVIRGNQRAAPHM